MKEKHGDDKQPVVEKQKPSVGRIVHYYPDADVASPPYAAIITAVDPHTDTVTLNVFDPGGICHGKARVSFSPDPQRQHWCWPPKV